MCQRYQYLSFYDGREYRPIAIAEGNKGRADFVNLEKGLIYFPTHYNAESKIIQSSFFPVLSGEEQHVFIPDTANLDSVNIWRKYPMQKTKAFLSNAVGMRIDGMARVGANKSFSIQLTDTPTINIIKISLPRNTTFRFISICAPDNNRIELSEIRAVTPDGPVSPVSVISTAIGTEDTKSILSTITDDRWETCYVSKKNGESIIIDFGQLIRADELTIVPRTDDNFVHPGDEYELFYHAGINGWKSLGRKTASGSCLDYAVPRNAVLWLKNHTRGKEERPFYIEQGTQIFP